MLKLYKKNGILFVIIFLALIISYHYFHGIQKNYLAITSFDDCVKSGFTVTKSYPETCIAYRKMFTHPDQEKYTPTKEPLFLVTGEGYKELTYIIDGEPVRLYGGEGMLTKKTPQGVSTSSFKLFDKPFLHDINNDSIPDTVFVLQAYNSKNKESYYISSAVSLREGYVGTNAVYIDSSINPFKITYKNGMINVLYTANNKASTTIEKRIVFEHAILKAIP